MALRINEKNGVIYLEGNINSTNYTYVQKHIKEIMKNSKDLILNIKQIKSIDANGISCIREIKEYASNNFRDFSIIYVSNLLSRASI